MARTSFLALALSCFVGCLDLGDEPGPRDASAPVDSFATFDSATADSSDVDVAPDSTTESANDSTTEESLPDALTDGDAAVDTSPNLLVCASDGRYAYANLSESGIVTFGAKGTTVAGLTHLVASSHGRALGYAATSGVRYVLTLADPIESEPVDAEAGWTHFVRVGEDRVLAYRASDGAVQDLRLAPTFSIAKTWIPTGADAEKMKGHKLVVASRSGLVVLTRDGADGGEFVKLRWDAALPSTSPLSTGGTAEWQLATPLFDNYLFFGKTGAEASAAVLSRAVGVDLVDFYSWSKKLGYLPFDNTPFDRLVATPRTLLYYASGTGTIRAATIKFDADLEGGMVPFGVPDAGIGSGWSLLTALD